MKRKLSSVLREAKQGDAEALMEILLMFDPVLRKYSYKLGYEDAKQDLILELLGMINKMPLLELEGKIVSYIASGVCHAYIALSKKQRQRKDHEQALIPEMMGVEKGKDLDFGVDLENAVQELNDRQKQILHYKMEQGKTDTEIASLLGITRKTVYKNRMRMMEVLKKELYY